MILDTDRRITVNNGVITIHSDDAGSLVLEDGKKFMNGDKVLQKDVGKDLYKKLKELGRLAK